MSIAGNSSPYAADPGRVAHAYMSGRAAADSGTGAVSPFDPVTAPDEHGAWTRGFRLAHLLQAEG